jgi:hypothetical protein
LTWAQKSFETRSKVKKSGEENLKREPNREMQRARGIFVASIQIMAVFEADGTNQTFPTHAEPNGI